MMTFDAYSHPEKYKARVMTILLAAIVGCKAIERGANHFEIENEVRAACCGDEMLTITALLLMLDFVQKALAE